MTTTPRPHDDVIRVMGLVIAIGGLDDLVMCRVIGGAPPSKARPRFLRNGHAYVTPEARAAEAQTKAQLRRFMKTPMTGNVALACIFVRPNRQRIDVDNMLKHVCDAANRIAWHDDSQITALVGIAEYDPNNPRTVLAIAPHVSTLQRGSDAVYPCAQCGKPIPRAGQTNLRKTCSQDCAARLKGQLRLDDPVPCAHCGTPFVRVSQYRKLCSPECRTASITGKRKAAASPNSNCTQCGKELAHKRGGRCRACWQTNPAGEPDDQGA